MLGSVRDAIQRGGALDPSQTNTFYYILWQEDGAIMARSPGAPADVPAPGRPHELRPFMQRDRLRPVDPAPPLPPAVRTRGQMRELFRFLPRGQCLLVGRSLAPDVAAMRRLALWLVAAGTAVLALGLAGGWWAATRAIRPIEAISATAVKIAGGDLSQRINAADTDSELGRLAGVLNSTFARLEATFTQQARFTSDASHELRTPVSVILSQTQTALARERPAPEYREALEACQRAARRMKIAHRIPARTRAPGRRPGTHEAGALRLASGRAASASRWSARWRLSAEFRSTATSPRWNASAMPGASARS